MNKMILSLAMLLLCSCGFKLKGTHYTRPLPVQHWQISGQALQSELEKVIYATIGQTPPFSGSPEAEIRVLSVENKKDVYTITRAAKLNEYLLSLRVSAQAFRHGQAWGKPMYIDIRRTMPYTDSMVLGKEEEEAIIWREMRQDVAEQIVRQLSLLPDYPSTTVQE